MGTRHPAFRVWEVTEDQGQSNVKHWWCDASNDRQQKDDLIIHLAINDKATRLQVIENMPDMMQLRKKVIPQSMQN